MRSGILILAVGGISLAVVGCEAPPQAAVTDDETARLVVDRSTELGQLAWLAGAWINNDGRQISEEHWTLPAGGTMLGVNRTIIDGETVAFEFLRIEETPQGIVYYASPGGRFPPTAFGLLRLTGQRVVFSTADHDFPTRIRYHRQGNRLYGAIEGEEDGEMKTSQWTWQLARP